MGCAYSYCREPGCEMGIGKATASEVVGGEQLCALGHSNTPNVTKDSLLVELANSVELLKLRIVYLERVVIHDDLS